MDKPAPLELSPGVVRPEWLDYNGHMNVAYYVLAFDHACDSFLDHIGMTYAYRARSGGTTTARTRPSKMSSAARMNPGRAT